MRILFFLACCLLSIAVSADTISLPTTGQSTLTGTSTEPRDSNYTVTWPVITTSTTAIGASAAAWIAPTGSTDPKWKAGAPWITPLANPLADLPGGTYTFSVDFDLPENVTSITGSLYVDDRVSIWLNGKLITELPTTPGSGYWASPLSTFTITSGFVVGTNTLEFRVINTNANTPVGLAVTQLTANTAAPVPEPATLLLLGSGLAGLATTLRKRGRK